MWQLVAWPTRGVDMYAFVYADSLAYTQTIYVDYIPYMYMLKIRGLETEGSE